METVTGLFGVPHETARAAACCAAAEQGKVEAIDWLSAPTVSSPPTALRGPSMFSENSRERLRLDACAAAASAGRVNVLRHMRGLLKRRGEEADWSQDRGMLECAAKSGDVLVWAETQNNQAEPVCTGREGVGRKGDGNEKGACRRMLTPLREFSLESATSPACIGWLAARGAEGRGVLAQNAAVLMTKGWGAEMVEQPVGGEGSEGEGSSLTVADVLLRELCKGKGGGGGGSRWECERTCRVILTGRRDSVSSREASGQCLLRLRQGLCAQIGGRERDILQGLIVDGGLLSLRQISQEWATVTVPVRRVPADQKPSVSQLSVDANRQGHDAEALTHAEPRQSGLKNGTVLFRPPPPASDIPFCFSPDSDMKEREGGEVLCLEGEEKEKEVLRGGVGVKKSLDLDLFTEEEEEMREGDRQSPDSSFSRERGGDGDALGLCEYSELEMPN
uniref:Uncharacterized protein n=1 Tax=Chromera velia CCMP2878 TaxID=1169474 RepID=A0A0G4GVL1_9ALVE|eukprot:Cvel_23589.t1-p1 / transcript=Cvel_23589.t1 / gene=Cvel_23589 / organism=Chromera_velia_CCMP2878 / gene_product=hypothetical protein / transcript_product=hypothetical protein / location=Cvel_scaffold2449:20180-21746(-) / protein_length=448 / sequence_SO=supercontig / SO=protein_coding / is_pseudo=false